jgi:hypothetical protein
MVSYRLLEQKMEDGRDMPPHETSASVYQTAQRHILESCNLDTHHRDRPKHHKSSGRLAGCSVIKLAVEAHLAKSKLCSVYNVWRWTWSCVSSLCSSCGQVTQVSIWGQADEFSVWTATCKMLQVWRLKTSVALTLIMLRATCVSSSIRSLVKIRIPILYCS